MKCKTSGVWPIQQTQVTPRAKKQTSRHHTVPTKISTNTANDSTEMKTTDTTTISANDMTDKEGIYIARIYP